ITLLDSAVDDFLRLMANYRTGVTWCSAEKIRVLCPRGIGLREIQRSLGRLEELGRIKRFRAQGRRGNYPVVVGDYFVRDSSQNWFRVNLSRTSDWRDVQYDSVTDPSEVESETVTRRGSDVPHDADRRDTRIGIELSPLKEEEEKIKNATPRNGNASDEVEDEVESGLAHGRTREEPTSK